MALLTKAFRELLGKLVQALGGGHVGRNRARWRWEELGRSKESAQVRDRHGGAKGERGQMRSEAPGPALVRPVVLGNQMGATEETEVKDCRVSTGLLQVAKKPRARAGSPQREL